MDSTILWGYIVLHGTAEWPHQEYLIAESEERTDSGIVQIHLYILLQNQVQNEEVLSEDFQTAVIHIDP